MPKKIIEQVRSYQFFTELTELPFIDKIVLFGSRSKKIYDERADIDLAITCSHATESDWNKILEIVENADTLLSIDCVRFDQIKSERFRESILANHITLYTRG